MKRKKITIIGAGNVGATCAHWAVIKELGDVVLYDIVEGIPQGKALDLTEAAPVNGYDCLVSGTNDIVDTAESDIIIITAGIARKPGMSRGDLLNTNANIVRKCTEDVVNYSPNACILVVSNPVDVITHVAFKTSGFEPRRVFGLSGVLDSARFKAFIAMELGVSFEDITTLVLGGHGDDMVPLIRYTYAGGIPVEKLMSKNKFDLLIERTRKGGAEIVNYLKTGSAYYAPSASVVHMAESILKDKKRILPITTYLQGEYGHKDVFAGVPAIVGGNGVEKIIEIDLAAEEKAALDKSINNVKELMKGIEI